MSKFKKGGSKDLPAISTASLPDIVFMLLFFFMVTTKMKEITLKIQYRKPGVTQAAKLQNRTLVSNIYIGKPLTKFQSTMGSEPRIQLDDSFKSVSDVGPYVQSAIDKTAEGDRGKRTVSLKVDKETRMGIVTDVKEALRDINALKINYAAKKDAIIDDK